MRGCLKTSRNLCRRVTDPSGLRFSTNQLSNGKLFQYCHLRRVTDPSPQNSQKMSKPRFWLKAEF